MAKVCPSFDGILCSIKGQYYEQHPERALRRTRHVLVLQRLIQHSEEILLILFCAVDNNNGDSVN